MLAIIKADGTEGKSNNKLSAQAFIRSIDLTMDQNYVQYAMCNSNDFWQTYNYVRVIGTRRKCEFEIEKKKPTMIAHQLLVMISEDQNMP